MATTFQRSNHVDTTHVGDRLVVYSRVNQTSLVLNPTGSEVWSHLEQPHSTEQLVDLFAQKYPSEQTNHIASDIENYVQDLVHHGVVSTNS